MNMKLRVNIIFKNGFLYNINKIYVHTYEMLYLIIEFHSSKVVVYFVVEKIVTNL
jgi:hypothetical protein